jgi:DNA-binding transcriptional MerR regulator
MNYTIQQAADKVHLTVHTLRFYDKEGLLPFVERSPGGNRVFSENNLEWLNLICCLKNSGMSIKHIRGYIQSSMQGDSTLEQRRQILVEHRDEVLKQIAELQRNLEMVEYKIEHYNTLCNPACKSSQNTEIFAAPSES